MTGIDDETSASEWIDGDRPTAQPSSMPSTDPIHPAIEVLVPNLSRVSAATFRRGSLSRRRVNRAVGMLLAIAVLTALIVIFGDFVSARLGTFLYGGLVAVLAVGTAGLVLLLRDERRERRAARDRDE